MSRFQKAGIVPRCMIMTHLRPAGPLQPLHLHGFLAKVKVLPCSLDVLEAATAQASACDAESSENQNAPLVKVRVILRSSRALLGDR